MEDRMIFCAIVGFFAIVLSWVLKLHIHYSHDDGATYKVWSALSLALGCGWLSLALIDFLTKDIWWFSNLSIALVLVVFIFQFYHGEKQRFPSFFKKELS